MVCGSLTPGFDNACNFCGSCAKCCCPVGNERCCDCCNHCFCCPMCCEMCPCGANGCIGFPNHLCGCCGNCNLMWYASCCPACFVADMYVSTTTVETPDQAAALWSNVVCNCVLLMVLYQICNNVGGMGPDLRILRLIGFIFEIAMYVYATVIFGYSATKIAAMKGYQYDAAECCTTCHDEGCIKGCMLCCNSLTCFCTYCCCFDCHFIQVARVMETNQDFQNKVLANRPTQCQCCNCWDTKEPLVELSTQTGTAEP